MLPKEVRLAGTSALNHAIGENAPLFAFERERRDGELEEPEGCPCLDLKREGAYPCMYQMSIDGNKVYRVRVRWDAGNEVYSKFLDVDRRCRITGYTFGEEKKRGTWPRSFASSGRSGPSIRAPWQMQASAMCKGCTGPWAQ